jgi:hypothetical protein
MVSHKKKFIFIHIPKTGGTSIYSALHKYGIMLYRQRNEQSIYYKHAYASDLKRMLGDEFDTYYKFAFVRNPFDWIISNYHFNRGLHQPYTRPLGLQHYGHVQPEYEALGFDEWLYWWVDKFNPLQSRMMLDSNNNLLVDDIYHFETIGADFKKLCKKINVNIWPRKLQHTNKTSRSAQVKDKYAVYSNDHIEFIQDRFKLDFELFGYPKELKRKVSLTEK